MPTARPAVSSADLAALNSLTKYPSIPTYHPLTGGKGRLGDGPDPLTGPVVLTEKVDGTNARVCVPPGGGYLIGSRSEWLTARGDLVANPAMGIVGAVRGAADRLAAAPDPDALLVYYGEVYGGSINGAGKQYAGGGGVGFRLFDVARHRDHAARLALPPDELSAWREAGGPAFLSEPELTAAADRFDLPLTPRLGTADALPTDLAETLAFLEATLPATRAALDEMAAGDPEGIVARTADRSKIVKLRFQDYRRTLGVKGPKRGRR